MRRVLPLLLLALLAWQTGELFVRRFVWAQDPPELPLGAFLFLLALNLTVLGTVSRKILRSRPKFVI